MNYFNTLPIITQKDFNNNTIVVNSLLSRSYIIPSLLRNVTIFYEYDIKEGDTPENIAHRYYGDVYKYWLVMYSNNIIDPQSQWPLSYNQFQLYLIDKYKHDTANSMNVSVANVTSSDVLVYTANTIHHYEKVITTSDSVNFQNQIITLQVDKDTYDSTMEQTITRTFNTGIVATIKTEKNVIRIYDYEEKLNESKRKIYILNSSYASEMEKQFQTLMES